MVKALRDFTTVILVLVMAICVILVMTPAAGVEGVSASTSLEGLGSEDFPFLISSAEDLTYMRNQVNTNSTITPSEGGAPVPADTAHYQLTGNIVLGYWRDDGDGIVEDGEIYDSETDGSSYTASNWRPLYKGLLRLYSVDDCI